MDELDELNKRICQLRGEAPGIKYWAMNEAETSIFIEFDSLIDAGHWMTIMERGHAEYVKYNGIHIVRREIWRDYAGDIAAAYALEDSVPPEQHKAFEIAMIDVIADDCKRDRVELNYWMYFHATPEQRCRAYLAWKEQTDSEAA